MLVLTRRLGEEIVIGGNVFVRVVGIEGGKVRIGIAAPESVVIDRSEVHARRLAFNEESHTEAETLPQS
jgi:carbon storage regulator